MSTAATVNSECRPVPFVLFGAGGVGAALLEAIVGARKLHEERYGIRFDAIAVADSQEAIGSAAGTGTGLTDAEISALIKQKASGQKLSGIAGVSTIASKGDAASKDFLLSVVDKAATSSGSPAPIVVDCTATDATVPSLLKAAEELGGAVSANKKPFASEMGTFKRLVLTPMGPRRVRYESTVGAGLPVLAALSRVVGANDQVSLISGSFSGTLGYVMSGLQDGKPFSEVVLKAKELGYTEPDPRDDLGGVDVARKALILARTLGMPLEMSDVAVEPLFPPELAELSVPDFLAKLPTLDADFAAKVASAASEGKVLRYAASVKPPSAEQPAGSLVVGLLPVPAASPLGTLTGSDNLVEVYTTWYASTPLVLRGAGAGTGTTAAGVLSDMLELANTA